MSEVATSVSSARCWRPTSAGASLRKTVEHADDVEPQRGQGRAELVVAAPSRGGPLLPRLRANGSLRQLGKLRGALLHQLCETVMGLSQLQGSLRLRP